MPLQKVQRQVCDQLKVRLVLLGAQIFNWSHFLKLVLTYITHSHGSVRVVRVTTKVNVEMGNSTLCHAQMP